MYGQQNTKSSTIHGITSQVVTFINMELRDTGFEYINWNTMIWDGLKCRTFILLLTHLTILPLSQKIWRRLVKWLAKN